MGRSASPVLSPLALHGGKPVRAQALPYGHHTVTDEDVRAVVDVLRSGRLTTGPAVEAFESAVAKAVEARYAVAMSSGTAALHAAVFAAGIGPGDEAITTPLTFCATANVLLYQGARPVFADVSPDTLNLDPREAAARITPRTKAILPVDYAGHPADLDAFLELAKRHKLVVIEDACHALGAALMGRRVGGISHMTVFSFHPVKHITTGEGGMVTTNDAALAKRLRLFRNHGIKYGADADRPWRYDMTALGCNYRISDINCALGRSQLTRLQTALDRRAQIALRYTQALSSLPGVTLPAASEFVRHAWHLYPVRLDPASFQADRDEMLRALRAEGIVTTVHFPLVYRHAYYQSLSYRDEPARHPVAEAAAAQLISLPMFHGMTDEDVEDVIQAVWKVMAAYAR